MLTFGTGNKAVAMAVRDAKPVVVAAYPITPQTVCPSTMSHLLLLPLLHQE
jgi:pyruvate/2-oxoacid:ferredoxin oxidoreductase alpha subunit